MIRVEPFTSTDPLVIPVGQNFKVEVSYEVEVDSAQTIGTTYVGTKGCVVLEKTPFSHPVNNGSNQLKDIITVHASSLVCEIQLTSCTKTNECSSTLIGILGKMTTSNFATAFAASNDIKLESVFILTDGNDHIFMNESKAKVHKLLKDRGYAFDKSKKIWKHGKNKK